LRGALDLRGVLRGAEGRAEGRSESEGRSEGRSEGHLTRDAFKIGLKCSDAPASVGSNDEQEENKCPRQAENAFGGISQVLTAAVISYSGNDVRRSLYGIVRL
jgi:hypothetical protein